MILNDGITIVKNINFITFNEDCGQFLVKDVLQSMNERVGDGTSTTGILISNLITNGLSYISAGFQSQLLYNGIATSCNILISKLNFSSSILSSNIDALQLATNSAGGDSKLGKLIIKAFQKVGLDGLINIEESEKRHSSLTIFGGIQLERGYVSNKFVNNFAKSTWESNDCAIIVTDLQISKLSEVVKILQIIMEINKPLLIISDDIDKTCLNTIITNNNMKRTNICCLKIPSFGNYRKALLQDIAIATGSLYLSKDSGFEIINLKNSFLGQIKKCIVSDKSCSIVSNNKFKLDIKARINFLENLLLRSDSVFETNFISERIAKLSGGVAIIRLGASSNLELNDKKLRAEDAKNAVFSALSYGVMPGAGSSMLHFSNFISRFSNNLICLDIMLGTQLIKEVLEIPYNKIMQNSFKKNSLIKRSILMSPFEIGFNSNSNCLSNLLKDGVLDPSYIMYNCLILCCFVVGVIFNAKLIISRRKINTKIKNYNVPEKNIDSIYLFNM